MVALTDFALKVELSTAGTPRSSAPSYTDITTYVRAGDGISLNRGRDNETDPGAQPGTASVSLRNTDARFTMGNGSSPYAPLQLRRPCRFSVTYSASTYQLWQGFVDSWGNGRDSSVGVARLSLSDRVARANKAIMQPSLTYDMLSDSPHKMWALTEPAGSTSYELVGGADADALSIVSGAAGSWSLGSGHAAGVDGESCLSVTRGSATLGPHLNNPRGAVIQIVNAMTAEVSFRPDTAMTAMTALAWGIDTGIGWTVGVTSNGLAYFRNDPASTTLTGVSTLSLTAMNVVAVTATAPSGGNRTWTLKVNGVTEASATMADINPFVGGLDVGGYTVDTAIYSAPTGGAMFSGDISHVAFYSSVLSDARLLSHAQCAATGWQGEATDVRFDRWCAQAGVPSTFYSAATGQGTMAGQAVLGRALYDVLRDVATVENGDLYADKTGVLTLIDRRARYNKTVGLTLDASKAGQVLAGTDLVTDDSLLLNDYTVSIPSGYSVRVTDSTSITNYDTHSTQDTIHTDSTGQAINAAQWDVATLKTPTPRSDGIVVDVVAFANTGGNVANLLNADIGTRLNVTNMPADTSGSSTLDLFIEGIRHNIGPSQWTVTFLTSPVGLYGTTFVLDTNVLDGTAILPY